MNISSISFRVEALPGVGEQGKKSQILRGTQIILGNMEHKKTNFRILGNRGTSQFISGNNGTGTPPGGPQSSNSEH